MLLLTKLGGRGTVEILCYYLPVTLTVQKFNDFTADTQKIAPIMHF